MIKNNYHGTEAIGSNPIISVNLKIGTEFLMIIFYHVNNNNNKKVLMVWPPLSKLTRSNVYVHMSSVCVFL